QGLGQNQPSVTTTRNGYGTQMGIDNGNNAVGTPNGFQFSQPCSIQGASAPNGFGAGTGGGNGTSGGYGNALPPCPTNYPNQFPQMQPMMMLPPYIPGEFELYVQTLVPTLTIRRLGADLMRPHMTATDISPLVPPDYLIVPGDELDIA